MKTRAIIALVIALSKLYTENEIIKSNLVCCLKNIVGR